MTETQTQAHPASLPRTETIWMNGRLIPWEEATTHVLSHVLHYGSSVFEGIRCYKAERGPAVFRLADHMKRLLFSAKTYRMPLDYDLAALCQATRDVVKTNGLEECYIRPLIYRGLGQLGVNPLTCPVHMVVAAWPWGSYFDPELKEKGIDCCVTSWTRPGPNTLPLMAKAGANYLNSQLIKMEALGNGYHEGIALDVAGYVSEASGENVFITVNDGLVTPPSSASVLPGITRHTVIKLAQHEGIKINRQMIPREGLYVADEIFLTGTAAEVAPVRSVDRLPVGTGERGPITTRLQELYAEVVTGRHPAPEGWLDYVE